MTLVGCSKAQTPVSDIQIIKVDSSPYYEVFTVTDENFEVKTFINGLEFEEDEEIRMHSTIEYIGNEEKIDIWSGDPFFIYTIQDGVEYFNEGIVHELLMKTELKKGEIFKIPFSQSGGYSADDPKAAYWKEFFSEKELKLPKGEYIFTAATAFSLDKEQKEKVVLKNKFYVKIK